MAKKRVVLIVLLALVSAVSLVSITAGSSGITLREVFVALIGRGTSKTNAILWNVRLPRIMTAIVVACRRAPPLAPRWPSYVWARAFSTT